MLFIKIFCGFIVTADFKKYVFNSVFTAFIKKIVHKAVCRSLLSVFRYNGNAIQLAFVRYALTADKAYRLVFGFLITNNGIDRAFCEHL